MHKLRTKGFLLHFLLSQQSLEITFDLDSFGFVVIVVKYMATPCSKRMVFIEILLVCSQIKLSCEIPFLSLALFKVMLFYMCE